MDLQGIRNNILKLYRIDSIKNCNLKKNEMKYRSLLLSLAFFHSILIERKKFQNLGWNAGYSFTEADFKVSNVINILPLFFLQSIHFLCFIYIYLILI